MLSNMLRNMVHSYIYFIGRKNVVACHKAGIMKMGDGLFIKIASEVAKKYPEINYHE
jgi:isocitrate dehydrogenase (NAD+)